MKKLNNRGFLLVETVIVSVFVLTIFVLVYQNSLPLMSEYQQRIRYDQLDTVYATGLIRKLFLNSSDYESLIQDVDVHGYRELSCNDLISEQRGVCKVLFRYLGIYNETDASLSLKNGKTYNMSRVFITNWDISSKLLESNRLPKGFVEYISYLRKENQESLSDYRILLSRTVLSEEDVLNNNQVIEKSQDLEIYYANLAFKD